MIDTLSPPGSYRAALAPNASCALCAQAIYSHDDLTYAGIAPAMFLKSARPLSADDSRPVPVSRRAAVDHAPVHAAGDSHV